ncbi:MAG: TetR family transcriptional regulator [Candidatus Aminicenantales bacterium]
MTVIEARDSKKRILDAAISLFARKGYAAVGVREIASEAGVNIAMISYYFDGKVGILKAIIDTFFSQYSQLLVNIDDRDKTLEESVRTVVHRLVQFIRCNTELTLVTYNELPLDVPEIAEMKARKVKALLKKMSGLIRRFGLDPDDILQLTMVFPSLVAMIFAHFRMRPVLAHVLDVNFDDAYYERLTGTLATLFFGGIQGLSARKQKRQKRK